MQLFNKILSTTLLVPLIGLLLFLGTLPLVEGYNIVAPYADTEFAIDYSPKKFNEITLDMDISTVLNLIGEPMSKSNDTVNNKAIMRYDYTNDGFIRRSGMSDNVFLGDLAWYKSVIIFDENGKIINIEKGWIYD